MPPRRPASRSSSTSQRRGARTCAAQKPILDKLHAEAKFKDIVVFNIDFDTQKALVRKFGATMQSTLIVYTGLKEEGRSSGETQPAAIESLLAKSV